MNPKVSIKDISNVEKQIEVTIAADTVAEELDNCYRTLRSSVKIKGFRPGKTPRSVLERFYGKQAETEVLNKLINDSFQEIIKEHNINPVSQPIIDNDKLKSGQDFTYRARVEVAPEISLHEDYLDLEAEQEKVNVTDEVVDNYLNELRNFHSQLKNPEADRPIGSGDFVLLDFAGSIEGIPLQGGEGKDKLIEIKPEGFLPGFTDQLTGLTPGTKKEITITVPDDYTEKELSGKTINFQVNIKEIKEKIIPPLDDNFARDMGEFETLADLKKQLKKDIILREERRVRSLFYDNIIQKIIENTPFEVPPSLVEKQTEYLIQQSRSRMNEQGMKIDSSTVVNRELKETHRPIAESQVKRSFLLQAIAAKEEITVSPAEIKKELDNLAASSGGQLKNLTEGPRQEELQQHIKEKVLEDKTLAFLAEKTKIKVVDNKESL